VAEDDPREGRSRIDEALRPFFDDSMLWPLMLVGVSCFASIGAFVIALALERNLFAVGALLGLVWLSFDGVRASFRGGRPGPAAIAILALWILSALGATLGIRLGLL
jgi:hypothetical protein